MPLLEIQECRDLLVQVGSYFDVKQTGEHYRLRRSGLHVGNFYDLSRAFQYRSFTEQWARLLTREICNTGILKLFRGTRSSLDDEGPLIIFAPAFTGIPLQHALAAILPVNDVRTVTLTKNKDNALEVPPWFEQRQNTAGIFVDDLIATGGTLRAVINAFPGLVVALAVGIDRTPNESQIFLPKVSVARDPEAAYEAEVCPWCRKSLPIVDRPKSRIILPSEG